MCSVTNKILPAATAALLIFASCGGIKKDDTVSRGRAEMAERLDSIQNECLLQIAEADSAIEADRNALDRLKPLMKHIDVEGIEGYYVCADGYIPEFANSTGVSARVSENGEFYLISSVNPAGGLKHVSVSAVCDGMTVTTPQVAYDGDINFRIGDSEMITFSPAQSDSIGSFIYFHHGSPVTLRFNGASGKSKTVKLSQKQADNIATAYEYAFAVNSMRRMTIERERLEKRLELAKTQAEKYSADADTKE